jgi:hypothetical protein
MVSAMLACRTPEEVVDRRWQNDGMIEQVSLLNVVSNALDFISYADLG